MSFKHDQQKADYILGTVGKKMNQITPHGQRKHNECFVELQFFIYSDIYPLSDMLFVIIIF